MIQRKIDADFLVVALWRFLELARRVANGPFATDHVRAALAKFEKAVPNLQDIRDTQEHYLDYESGKGKRQKQGEQPSGFGYGLGPSVALTYGPFMLHLGEATDAANSLHRAIRAAVDELASQDVHADTPLITTP